MTKKGKPATEAAGPTNFGRGEVMKGFFCNFHLYELQAPISTFYLSGGDDRSTSFERIPASILHLSFFVLLLAYY